VCGTYLSEGKNNENSEFALLSGAPLVATPVAAEDMQVDLSKLTCKQFTACNNDNRGLVMMRFEVTTPRITILRWLASRRCDFAQVLVYSGNHDDMVTATNGVICKDEDEGGTYQGEEGN
jgi:hypothetical protein